jgi:hypothetical protein
VLVTVIVSGLWCNVLVVGVWLQLPCMDKEVCKVSLIFADGTPACQLANDPQGQHADEPRASTEAML